MPKQGSLIWAMGLSILAIAGCTEPPLEVGEATPVEAQEKKSSAKEMMTVAIPESDVTVEFPVGWYENPDEYPFDLQYFSKNQEMNTGIFVYGSKDSAVTIDADSMLELRITDLESKRENPKVIQPVTKSKLADKEVTTTVLAAEIEESQFYYKLAVIEFLNNPEWLVATLQVTIPDEWEKNAPILEAITESLAIATTSELEPEPESTDE